MNDSTNNALPAPLLNHAKLVKEYESSKRPEPLRVHLADHLQHSMTTGTMTSGFLVENISAIEWYYAMVEFALRLRNPDILREIVAGMGHGAEPTRVDAMPLVTGLGQTGINVLDMLTESYKIYPLFSSRKT